MFQAQPYPPATPLQVNDNFFYGLLKTPFEKNALAKILTTYEEEILLLTQSCCVDEVTKSDYQSIVITLQQVGTPEKLRKLLTEQREFFVAISKVLTYGVTAYLLLQATDQSFYQDLSQHNFTEFTQKCDQAVSYTIKPKLNNITLQLVLKIGEQEDSIDLNLPLFLSYSQAWFGFYQKLQKANISITYNYNEMKKFLPSDQKDRNLEEGKLLAVRLSQQQGIWLCQLVLVPAENILRNIPLLLVDKKSGGNNAVLYDTSRSSADEIVQVIGMIDQALDDDVCFALAKDLVDEPYNASLVSAILDHNKLLRTDINFDRKNLHLQQKNNQISLKTTAMDIFLPKLVMRQLGYLKPFIQLKLKENFNIEDSATKKALLDVLSNFSPELIELFKIIMAIAITEDELKILEKKLTEEQSLSIATLSNKDFFIIYRIYCLLNICAFINLALKQPNLEQLATEYYDSINSQGQTKANFNRVNLVSKSAFEYACLEQVETGSLFRAVLPARMLLTHAKMGLMFLKEFAHYSAYLAAMPRQEFLQLINLNNSFLAQINKPKLFLNFKSIGNQAICQIQVALIGDAKSSIYYFNCPVGSNTDPLFLLYGMSNTSKYIVALSPNQISGWAYWYQKYYQDAQIVINDPKYQQAALEIILGKDKTPAQGTDNTIAWVEAKNGQKAYLTVEIDNEVMPVILDPYLIYRLAQLKPRAYLTPPTDVNQLHLTALPKDIFFDVLPEMVGLREFYYKFSLLNKHFQATASGAIFRKLQSGSNLLKFAGFARQAATGTGHCLYQAVARYLGQEEQQLHRKVLEIINQRYFLEKIIRKLENMDDSAAIDDKTKNTVIGKIKDRETNPDLHLMLLMLILESPIIIIQAEGGIERDSNALQNEYLQKFYKDLRNKAIFVYRNADNQYEALIYQGEELRLTPEQLKFNFEQTQKLKDAKLETRLKRLHERRGTVVLLQQGMFQRNSSEVKFGLFCQHIQNKSYGKALELLKSSVISAKYLKHRKNKESFFQEQPGFFQDLLAEKITLNADNVKIFKHLLHCNAFTLEHLMQFCDKKQLGKQDKFNVVARLSYFHLFFYSETTQQQRTTAPANFTTVKVFYEQLLNLDQVGPIKIDKATEAALKSFPRGEKALAVLVGGQLVAPRGTVEQVIQFKKSVFG